MLDCVPKSDSADPLETALIAVLSAEGNSDPYWKGRVSRPLCILAFSVRQSFYTADEMRLMSDDDLSEIGRWIATGTQHFTPSIKEG